MKLIFNITKSSTIKEFIYENISRNFYGYLKEHNVIYTVNENPKKSYEEIYIGDKLIITYDEEKNIDAYLSDKEIDIVYEDDLYIIIDKPSSLQSIPSRANPYDSVYNRLLYYFKETSYLPHLINRLDKETKGLMLIAKNNYARAILKDYDKVYIATTNYPLPLTEGIIDLPIKKVSDSIKRVIDEAGQKAITCYKLINNENNLYTYHIDLKTGRTHQIRVHFAYHKSPLINDNLYGGIDTGNSLGLVCKYLTFTNPLTNEKLKFESKYNV